MAENINSDDDNNKNHREIPDVHRCDPSCTHCRVCFNLDYCLLPRFEYPEGNGDGDGVTSSSLPNLTIPALNGCQSCSLHINGINAALAEDKTREAVEW